MAACKRCGSLKKASSSRDRIEILTTAVGAMFSRTVQRRVRWTHDWTSWRVDVIPVTLATYYASSVVRPTTMTICVWWYGGCRICCRAQVSDPKARHVPKAMFASWFCMFNHLLTILQPVSSFVSITFNRFIKLQGPLLVSERRLHKTLWERADENAGASKQMNNLTFLIMCTYLMLLMSKSIFFYASVCYFWMHT